MAASTRASKRLLLGVGLVLLQGCGSCVEDPNKGSAAGRPGDPGPQAARFSRTAAAESGQRPLRYLEDAQADAQAP